MATTRVIKGISFEPQVFAALELLRGNNSQFRSQYINRLIKEKLGLEK
jgi:hypothetical protein